MGGCGGVRFKSIRVFSSLVRGVCIFSRFLLRRMCCCLWPVGRLRWRLSPIPIAATFYPIFYIFLSPVHFVAKQAMLKRAKCQGITIEEKD